LITYEKRYVSVKKKFWISQSAAILWMSASILISLPWVRELAEITWLPLAILIIAGIAYIPGYLNAFLVCSLWIDRQPRLKVVSPDVPVTVIIAARNEERNIGTTIHYIAKQDYEGHIHVIVVDNGSTDDTHTLILHTQFFGFRDLFSHSLGIFGLSAR
jgi:biofilm PGA synthesis N-glycosyltransferase PgaC